MASASQLSEYQSEPRSSSSSVARTLPARANGRWRAEGLSRLSRTDSMNGSSGLGQVQDIFERLVKLLLCLREPDRVDVRADEVFIRQIHSRAV